jgi:hypothetical protein
MLKNKNIKMKHLKTYESFKMNEDYTQDDEIVRDKNKNDWDSMFNFFIKYNNGHLTKGDLMIMAYGKNYTGVDSAIPQNLANEIGNTFLFVYDYTKDSGSVFGKLVNLKDKLEFSNAPVAITIVVNGEALYNDNLPEELKSNDGDIVTHGAELTFHKALNYVFNHDEVQAFSIRPIK